MTRRRGAFAERSRSEIERDRDISDTTAVYPAISDNRKQTGVTHARDATRRSVRRSVPPSLPPTRSAGETRAPPPEMGSGARESLARGDSFRASAAESVKSVIGRPPGVAREGGREGGRGGQGWRRRRAGGSVRYPLECRNYRSAWRSARQRALVATSSLSAYRVKGCYYAYPMAGSPARSLGSAPREPLRAFPRGHSAAWRAKRRAADRVRR